MSKEFLTALQFAEELGMSAKTVRAWIAARRIECCRFGRSVRIPASEIRRLVSEGTVPRIESRQ